MPVLVYLLARPSRVLARDSSKSARFGQVLHVMSAIYARTAKSAIHQLGHVRTQLVKKQMLS